MVSDEEDRVIFQKRMANDLKVIAVALAPHRDETVGVMVESTYNWYWLVDGLMDVGYRVHLANASAIKKYEGLKYQVGSLLGTTAYRRACQLAASARSRLTASNNLF